MQIIEMYILKKMKNYYYKNKERILKQHKIKYKKSKNNPSLNSLSLNGLDGINIQKLFSI